VGEFVAAERERFVVATKYTLFSRKGDPNSAGNHRKNLVQSLEASLKRLRLDCVDLYWVHAWDYLTPVDEVMRALDDVVRAGKALYVGISEHARLDRLARPHTRRAAGLDVVRRDPDRVTASSSARWSASCSRWRARSISR